MTSPIRYKREGDTMTATIIVHTGSEDGLRLSVSTEVKPGDSAERLKIALRKDLAEYMHEAIIVDEWDETHAAVN